MRRLLAVILALLPAPALAQGFAIRVTPEGVDQLNELARQRVPPSYAVQEFETIVMDCPATDRNVTGHVPPTDVALGWHELDLRVEDGRFFVSTTIDIDVATPVMIDNPYACFGEATCDVTASVRTLGIDVELAAATGPEGGIEFHGTEVDLALTADDLDMESENCAIGEVALFLFDIFESWALELMIPLLETMLGEKLSEAMTGVFDETVGLTVEAGGFTIRGWLDELELSSSSGITTGGDAAITWSGDAAFEAPSPELHDPSGDALPRDFQGQFQLAASDRLVTSALYEAWRGGLIHSLLAAQSRTIELGEGGVVQQLGLAAGTSLEIAVDIEQPLEASFGREEPNVAEIALAGLHVQVQIVSPSGKPGGAIDVRADGSIQAALTVDASLGGLVLDLVDLDISQLSIEAGDSEVVTDRARLRAFIEGTVTPMLAESLAGVPVAPALHSIGGTFIHLRSVESEGGWQRLGADLVLSDPSDLDPPDTFFVDAPALVPAGTAAFSVSGNDASTPQGLLRYRAWLDGELIAEEPSSIRTIRAGVEGGAHVLEVAAVDLNGNEDPSRARHEFVADGTLPVLTVIEAPQAIHSDRTVHAAWEASDLEGSVQSAWELRLIGADGRGSPVAEAPFADRNELEIGDLAPGELYELEIVARDEAGNVTSETIGFAIDPNLAGGCAASPPRGAKSSRSFAVFAIFAVSIFFWTRRR